MELDKRSTHTPEKNSLCTHHVDSGKKEEQGILGSGNTAGVATCCVSLYADLKSATIETTWPVSLFLTEKKYKYYSFDTTVKY